MKTISQKTAREMLGDPEHFEGGLFVTKNGVAELFIQTAQEREAELIDQYERQQGAAMLKLVALSRREIAAGRTTSGRDLLDKLEAKIKR